MDLIQSVKDYNLNECTQLCKSGVNVNEQDLECGNTALMYAVLQDLFDFVHVLISFGANVNKRNKNGSTALMFAAENGNMSIVRKLVFEGAHIFSKNKDGDSPLSFAVIEKKAEIVRLLLLCGEDENVNLTYGKTTLLHLAVKKKSVEIVRALLLAGADVNATEEWGVTPLILAVQMGSSRIVEILLLAGAEIDTKDFRDTWTPLIWAITGAHIEIVKLLVKWGANPYIEDVDGQNAFWYSEETEDDSEKEKQIKQKIKEILNISKSTNPFDYT